MNRAFTVDSARWGSRFVEGGRGRQMTAKCQLSSCQLRLWCMTGQPLSRMHAQHVITGNGCCHRNGTTGDGRPLLDSG